MKTKGKSLNKKVNDGKTKNDSAIPFDEYDICAEIMGLHDALKQKEYELFELREKKKNRKKNKEINR